MARDGATSSHPDPTPFCRVCVCVCQVRDMSQLDETMRKPMGMSA